MKARKKEHIDAQLSVKLIPSASAMKLVMSHHYSRRKVGAKFCFGLFEGGLLIGCCVFSVPASYTLCRGVCGPEYKDKVIELSRLVVTTRTRNAASFFIASSVKHIAKLGDWILVSYADCNEHVGHVGYVYQATNWIYTGNGSCEPKWIVPSTGEVLSYTRRHIDKKAESIGLDWRDLIKVPQVGKHRYVLFCGSKKFKKKASGELRYEKLPYPKGSTKRHAEFIDTNMLF